MSKTFFRPPQAESTFWLWAKYALVAFGIVVVAVWLFACSGCASPGKVGFQQLHQQNAVEKRTLKATAVHAENIRRHTDRALQLTDDLAHTKLDPAQTKELDEIRVELAAVKQENTSLTQQLLQVQTIVIQRDATIAQTQAEVKAAERDSWWLKMKIRATWLAVGLVLGSVLLWIFRTAIKGAILAGAVYFPPLARLAGGK